eukprot:2935313-Rhodomonas_salina.2
MEKLGIIQAGTVLAADNVIYPGAPDFLDHVQKVSLRPVLSSSLHCRDHRLSATRWSSLAGP